MRRAGPLLVGLVLFAAPTAVTAQLDRSRPSFEHVHALAFDAAGRTLWLGAHTGLYILRCDNGGSAWAAARGAPKNAAAVTFNPGRPSEAHAVTTDGQILVSRDGGQTRAPVR